LHDLLYTIALCFQSKANPSKRPVLSLPAARKLNKEQAAVLTAVLSGKNVFFTGSAGTDVHVSHVLPV
jgi:hypothetical protein